MTPVPQVVILAGGLGTRLRAVAPGAPKPLVDVGGRPYLAWQIKFLRRSGFRDLVLCVGYRADDFRRTLGDGSDLGVSITYSCEDAPLGTGGALRLALPALRGDPVIVQNGDTFCEFDLSAVVGAHRAARAWATLVVTEVADGSRYGRVLVGPGGRVTGFREKTDSAEPGMVNAGTYVLDRRAIEALPPGRVFSLECDLFPSLCGRGLYAFPVSGPLLDIGTPESLAEARRFFEARRWRAPSRADTPQVDSGSHRVR